MLRYATPLLSLMAAAASTTALTFALFTHHAASSTVKGSLIITVTLAWMVVCFTCKGSRRPNARHYEGLDKDGNPLVTPTDNGYGIWSSGVTTADEPFLSVQGTPFDLTPDSESRYLREMAAFDSMQMRDDYEHDTRISGGRLLGATELTLYDDKDELAARCQELKKMAMTDATNGSSRLGGWKHRETDKKGLVVTELKKYQGTSTTAFCTVGDVRGMTPAELGEFMMDASMEARHRWDANCATAQVLESGEIPGGWGEYLSLIHISEPTRLLSISYAVFCLKKKKKKKKKKERCRK
eukprot:TRINITY_DN4001_c0_g4_i2.p1 TRINITY_DN4001_c0_g4~~TRINITY_DN4001_c0_g4_i2.p1  ORF type:complete len:297 (+),score=89.02 TRINITY_DN4001_c0_g4_i2:80-970(+)